METWTFEPASDGYISGSRVDSNQLPSSRRIHRFKQERGGATLLSISEHFPLAVIEKSFGKCVGSLLQHYRSKVHNKLSRQVSAPFITIMMLSPVTNGLV